MDNSREDFIKQRMIPLFEKLVEDTPAAWGKMNARQMVEHISTVFLVSAAIQHFALVTPDEHLPKYKEFLNSEKIFRENTKAPIEILGEEPAVMLTASLTDAIEQLRQSAAAFFHYFNENIGAQTLHPVFGMLTYHEWILLHYKHVTHHLRQFGLHP